MDKRGEIKKEQKKTQLSDYWNEGSKNEGSRNLNPSPCLEEYKLLRQEILSRQKARMLTLAYAVSAVGTMMGFLFKHGYSLSEGGHLPCVSFLLIMMAMLILLGALILTIHHTQQIDFISYYIRLRIDPKIGTRWETDWWAYRRSVHPKGQKGNFVPLGMSKPLAIYYAILCISVYFISFLNFNACLIFRALLTGCTFLCLYLCFDLYYRKSKSWKIEWKMEK